MAAGMGFPRPFGIIEGSCNKDNVSAMENQNLENLDNVKQVTTGKPPRASRNSIGSARLIAEANLVSLFFLSHPFVKCISRILSSNVFIESLNSTKLAFFLFASFIVTSFTF